LPELIKLAQTAGFNFSTLELDPDLEIPAYHRAVDIHCQPGGYHTEVAQNDVAAGAIYDRAVYLYAMGRMGRFNDDIGASTVAYLQHNKPDFRPKRILDLGCTVGHSTIPYIDAYPQESQRLQYALKDTARTYGFKRVEVIDCDLGMSASSGAQTREGFKQLLGSVAIGEVGIVLSRELSPLSRTDKDWCHLMELCQVFHTLIADAENLYDLNRLGACRT